MTHIISCSEVKSRIEKGSDFIFWDVRERWEFEENNIGARSMPLHEIPSKIDQLIPFQDQEIIVHCKTGDRSRRAQKFLCSNGFRNVKSMEGGIEAFLAG